MTSRVNGYVLTGGASSRMGKDKALLEINGRTLAARAARVLSDVADEVFTVGLGVIGYPVIRDLDEAKTSSAAIFGLQAAFRHSPTEWTSVLACDLPFITADLFRLMLYFARTQNAAAVVPEQPDGRAQPLAALYRTKPCRETVNDMIAADELRLGSFLDNIECRRVPPSEYSSLNGAELFFLNVNTPDEYQAAVRIAESRD